jgi:hypothetical protein
MIKYVYLLGNFNFWFLHKAGHVARRGEKRNAYRMLVGKPEGKRLLGCEDDIQIALRERGWGGMD